MIRKTGQIWNDHSAGHWIVVTTNIGWKKDGSNPMGAGIAKDAARRFPDLPRIYGRRCEEYGSSTAVWPWKPGKLILFPTKPLNEEQPWLSWQFDSCYELIERSSKQLAVVVKIMRDNGVSIPLVALPLVGCGNGGLEGERVIQILEAYLDDTFVLIDT